MKLTDIGEFELINHIAQRLVPTVPAGAIGIGDDCAVIPLSPERSLLVTTDLLVEGVHFLKATTSASDLGHKSLAVNLSDIAAMGGTPTSAFVSLALPSDTELAWVDDFYQGLGGLARDFGVAVLGGDTSRSPSGVTINITCLGGAHPHQIRLRSAAQPGDLICVAGTLGESAAGLALLSIPARLADLQESVLLNRHLRPEPLVEQGKFLAGQSGVHAMIDVSDGIDSDLRHILARSNCGARIAIETLRISPELAAGAQRYGWDAVHLACTGGEDYALLFTIHPQAREEIFTAFAAKFLTHLNVIGTITDRPGQLDYHRDGVACALKANGFAHFQR